MSKSMETVFSLQEYTGLDSLHLCPACGLLSYRLFIDTAHRALSEDCGRCDICKHEVTPEQYRAEHPGARPHYLTDEDAVRWKGRSEPGIIPDKYIYKSVRYDFRSDLFSYLLKYYSAEDVDKVIRRYHVGVTKDKAVIFPQIDASFLCRTAKIMRYDPETGHRIKEAKDKILWMHNILKSRGVLPEEWELTQCLFGEHLLTLEPDKVVCIVESEKTALIMSLELPQYLWLACGGKTNFSASKGEVLKGRKVVLYPDVDGFSEWTEKAEELRRHGLDVTISDYLKKTATEAEKAAKIDIADRVLQFHRERLEGCQNVRICDYSGIPLNVARVITESVTPDYQSEVFSLMQDLDLSFIRKQRINNTDSKLVNI